MKEVKFLIWTVLSLWFCGLTHLLKVSTGDFEVDKRSIDFPQFCPMQYEFLEFPVIPEIKEFCDETRLETTGHLDPRSLCWGFMVGMTSTFDQWKWKLLNRVWLFAPSVISDSTPWTVAHHAPLSMGFYRQEYWSEMPFPLPEDLPNPGIKPASSVSPALQEDSLPYGFKVGGLF